MRKLDDSKFCFISCVNDDFMYDECQFYLRHLDVPQGMSVDVLDVRGALSMTSGYQAAMEASDAKYKIYLHQDVFVVNRNLLWDLLMIFQSAHRIGLAGVAGAENLSSERPVWWESRDRYGKVYTRVWPEEIQQDVIGDFQGRYKRVAALDGLFLATQYDVPWRSDLFNGWHFYDISQSREFIERGYEIVVAGQKEPWLVHDCGRPWTGSDYWDNMEILKNHYRW